MMIIEQLLQEASPSDRLWHDEIRDALSCGVPLDDAVRAADFCFPPSDEGPEGNWLDAVGQLTANGVELGRAVEIACRLYGRKERK